MLFAMYAAVGPGDEEAARAADLIDSVAAYSDRLRWVVLIDDAPEARDLRANCRVPAGCRLTVLANPRQRAGPWRGGGLCVANLVAFGYVQRDTEADYLLKLDTDSLVIGPFEREVQRVLDADPRAGLLGVIGDSFGENRRQRSLMISRTQIRNILSMPDRYADVRPEHLEVVPPWPQGRLDAALYEDFLQARRVIQRAAANGRDTGEYCQGGAYVVSRRLLDAMAESGAFADPLVWRDLEICEDFRMGLHCGAAGLSIRDVSQSGPRFAIDPKCLAMSREELSRSPYSVIHSIRGSMEAEVRAFFRERRPARSMPAAAM